MFMAVWKLLPSDRNARKEISSKLGINPLLAYLLTVRGITTPVHAHRFLNPDLDFLNPPFVFEHMPKAVDMIKASVNKREKIFIHGDYDADGVTASALLSEALSVMRADVEVFLPHRIEHGYGLSKEGIDKAARNNAGLLITVDCGIASFDEVEYAKEQGLKVIITDHHLPREGRLPNADVILNPKIENCAYPFKELAGVGVALKLACALLGKDGLDLLDLAAIGTIADIVPLVDENRIIVKKGMEKISVRPRPGIRALMEKASVRKVNTRSIGFMIAPKINAAGRVGSAESAFRLLTESEYGSVLGLAEKLLSDNKERQRIEEEILKEAFGLANSQSSDNAIVIFGEGWHQGVIGIIASRIVDKFAKPCFVISLSGGKGKGSARSIEGINLKGLLEGAKDLLLDFGGHKLAAGFSIDKGNIELFKQRIEEICSTISIEEKALWADARVSFDMLTYSVVESIEALAPFGEGNPRPVFVARGVSLRGEIREMARNSIRFMASDGTSAINVVGFGKADFKDVVENARKFDMLFSVSINEYRGLSSVQAELLDIKSGDR